MTKTENVLIFGDSYSTFKGYIPEGYDYYYSENERPETDLVKVADTWWYSLCKEKGYNLILNDSWSGSTVGYTGYSGDCSRSSSFIHRLERLAENGFFKENKVDKVFVFGGTNDSWCDSPLGELKFSSFEREELFSSLPAVACFFSKLREALPDSEIICVVNDGLKPEIEDAFVRSSKKFGAKCIKLSGIDKKSGHPTIKGMRQIKEQLSDFIDSQNEASSKIKAEAVIFDKDGTLIDFDAFWVSLSVSALRALGSKINKSEMPVFEILEAFGVKDGVTDVNSVLCKGTYAQMGEIAYTVLKKYGIKESCAEITRLLEECYAERVDDGEVKPTAEGLKDVLLDLKERGIKLAVVTTDNEVITRKCLDKLGVTELFDEIYTDDGKLPPKPNPAAANALSERFGVAKENMLMVGDTMTDVRFARNARIWVAGVGKTEENRAILSPFADAVLPDISYLLNLLI